MSQKLAEVLEVDSQHYPDFKSYLIIQYNFRIFK